jgi:ribosomal protein L7/L12
MNIVCGKTGTAIVNEVLMPAKIVKLAALIRKLDDDEFGLMSHLLLSTDRIILSRLPKLDETKYDLLIESYPDNLEINIIKSIREITGLGLYEAKHLSEKMPFVLKSRISKYEVEKIVHNLEKDVVGIEVAMEKSLL